MLLKNAVKRLFKLLYVLGISPATFCERQQKLIVTRKSEKRMLRLTVFILVLVETFFITICVLSFSDVFNVYDTSTTGNKLIFLLLLESAAIQLILSTMFFVFRNRNVNIFEQILEFAERINCEECNKRIVKKCHFQCQLNVILIVLFISSNITFLVLSRNNFTFILYICNLIILGIHFIYSSIYLTCFTCLLFVAVESMRSLNNSIQGAKSMKELIKLLTLRNKLLSLCGTDLNLVYGFAIILQSGFTLTSISAFIFLTTVVFEWSSQSLFTILIVVTQTSLYSVPPFIIYVKAICANDVDKEVLFFYLYTYIFWIIIKMFTLNFFRQIRRHKYWLEFHAQRQV